jgi:hypothetical protein
VVVGTVVLCGTDRELSLRQTIHDKLRVTLPTVDNKPMPGVYTSPDGARVVVEVGK